MLDQPTQFIRRDHTTAQAKNDFVSGEILGSKETPPLDGGILDHDVWMDPESLR